MTTQLARLLRHDIEPFDVLFRNFFENDSFFLPVLDYKMNYPCDIQELDDRLVIEIAVPGIDKEEISIDKTDDILRVIYQNKQENKTEGKNYLQKSIAKRSFNFGWKVSDKFDLDKINAVMDKGLLKIEIPKAEEKKTKYNKIEIK